MCAGPGNSFARRQVVCQGVKADPAVAARISQLRRVVDFRNRLIHGYDSIDDAVTWGIVEKYLPQLVEEVAQLMRQAEAEERGL